MHRVLRVENDSRGEALGRGPEWSPTGILHILWAREDELLDLVAEVFFELEAGPNNAVLHAGDHPLALE